MTRKWQRRIVEVQSTLGTGGDFLAPGDLLNRPGEPGGATRASGPQEHNTDHNQPRYGQPHQGLRARLHMVKRRGRYRRDQHSAPHEPLEPFGLPFHLLAKCHLAESYRDDWLLARSAETAQDEPLTNER